jgi:hypothetical protein
MSTDSSGSEYGSRADTSLVNQSPEHTITMNVKMSKIQMRIPHLETLEHCMRMYGCEKTKIQDIW